MSAILGALERQTRQRPRAHAFLGEYGPVTYARLSAEVERLARNFRVRGVRRVAALLDNGPTWAAVDLAAQLAEITFVPLPPFFSDAQLRHAMEDADIELLLTDDPRRWLAFETPEAPACRGGRALSADYWEFRFSGAMPPALGADIAKITYTSGTTGKPKGVCLTQATLDRVAESLLATVGAHALARYVSLLPLGTLLENLAAIYLPLLAGTPSVLLSQGLVGMRGAAGLDAARMISALIEEHATSAVLMPQMLQALVERSAQLPCARLLAVGGAPVSPVLLERAAALGLPVYEGYGLSECASVVALNAPGAHRPGSVGRPLAHVSVRIAEDGEVWVAGPRYAGYLHEFDGIAEHAYWPTGDLGHLDADGYLFLTGRKKNMFITAYGRNVAPEWVERELTLQPAIAQAIVVGEARPWNAAVIVARAPEPQVAAAVAAANRRLPDYARVSAWLTADEPFTARNEQLTGTGRPRRGAILARYGDRLNALYDRQPRQEVYS